MADAKIHHLTIAATGHLTSRGEVYEIRLAGELVARGIAPEWDACRELERRGLDGWAHFWRAGKPHWDFRMNIPKGAKYQLSEGQKGFRVGKWSPVEAGKVFADADA
jgi:hypothetical protein